MNTIQIRPSLRLDRHREALDEIDSDCRDVRLRLERQQFETMSEAFRPHGGFVSGDAVTHRLRRLPDQPPPTFERWLVSRKVLSVRWRDQTLMPLFQFDLETMAIRPACTRVVDELKAVFNGWELALWFATPNTWLDCAKPVALLASDEFAVLQAARADRFISQG
jgi:hypothetical protein